MTYDVYQLIREVENRLDARPLTRLSEIATQLRLHRTTIERSVRVVKGISFRAFRQERIVEKIKINILENPGMTNKEIAFALGYSFPESFYRFIRISIGKTVTELRRELAERPCEFKN